MVQNEGEILYPPPPAPGGVEGHKRKSSHEIHALYGGPFLCSHRPQTPWAEGLHQMNQMGELLPWIGG